SRCNVIVNSLATSSSRAGRALWVRANTIRSNSATEGQPVSATYSSRIGSCSAANVWLGTQTNDPTSSVARHRAAHARHTARDRPDENTREISAGSQGFPAFVKRFAASFTVKHSV